MRAEEDKAISMHVDPERVVASHEDPDSDSKLPPLDEERVRYIPLGLDKRLGSLALWSPAHQQSTTQLSQEGYLNGQKEGQMSRTDVQIQPWRGK